MVENHTIGKECKECCCGGIYVHENCGGRMHEMLVDDIDEEGYIHNYRCDKCFEKEYQYGYEDMEIEFK